MPAAQLVFLQQPCLLRRGPSGLADLVGEFIAPPEDQPAGDVSDVTESRTRGARTRSTCVFYYCRTYYKAVRVGGGGEWRTCAMRDDEPRPV